MSAVEKPARRRRRWPWVLAALVLVIAVAAVIAEIAVRQYVASTVRERIGAALQMDDPSSLDVDLGGTPVLLQLTDARLDRVRVSTEQLAVGEVVGTGEVVVTDVPIDAAQPLGSLELTVSADEENVQRLSRYLSGVDLDSVELVDDAIRVGTDIDLAFVTLPVALDLRPSASAGAVAFEPTAVVVADRSIAIPDLTAVPGLGPVVDDLLTSQTVCIADRIPADLSLESVDVIDGRLVVRVSGDGAVLADLETTGTC